MRVPYGPRPPTFYPDILRLPNFLAAQDIQAAMIWTISLQFQCREHSEPTCLFQVSIQQVMEEEITLAAVVPEVEMTIIMRVKIVFIVTCICT